MRLVRPHLEHLDAALAGDEALARSLGVGVVPGWVSFTAALDRARDALAADASHSDWSTRLFVAGTPPEVVGWGGFKGPPQGGVVEIGYEIAPSRRNRGLAVSAAQAMVGDAFAAEGVTEVIAHTLPEPGASTRVLEKIGFRFDGETADRGEQGWRFRLARVDARPDRP